MQSKKEMPLEHKPILTIREASFYTGISEMKCMYIRALVEKQYENLQSNRKQNNLH